MSAVAIPAGARGQDPADPWADARYHLGPARFTPSFVFRTGLDTNVFNQSQNERSDLALELTPQIESWLKLGRTRLSGTTTIGFVYYQTYASERAINGRQEVRFDAPWNRVRFHAAGSVLSSSERPNVEVDLRARRVETALTAGVEVNPTPKTSIGLAAQRSRVDFGSEQRFLDVELRDVLNRTIETVSASVRRSLTPYTTVAFIANADRERFPFSPVRDSNSVRLLPGVEFHRFALLSGRAYVGYRRFEPLSGALPDFSGVVVSADLGYVLRGVTRFALLAERDLIYSVESIHPYYVQTGLTGTVVHHVGERWQLGGRLGRYLLSYRGSLVPPDLIDDPLARRVIDRADTVLAAGGDLRYRLGPATLLGLAVRQLRRRSAADGREFNGLRVDLELIYKDQP